MRKKVKAVLLTGIVFVGLLAGCQGRSDYVELHDPASVAALTENGVMDITPEMVPLTASPAMFTIPEPAAPGTKANKNAKVEVDYSHAEDGYIMIRYLQNTTKAIRVIVAGGQTNSQYTYSLRANNKYEVYPLSDGNGNYTISVFEQVDGNKFAAVSTTKFDVKLKNEFAPFIRSNQFVNYTKDSKTVAKAAELVKGLTDPIKKVEAVYKFVITFTYDDQKAKTVQPGYLPEVDKILELKKGICFDYAAVMAAMLRSQNVPTKLIVGYAGDVYHAWISVYSEEKGWIENVVTFDGKKWELMDPTFMSTGGSSDAVRRFIGDGKNYKAKYSY